MVISGRIFNLIFCSFLPTFPLQPSSAQRFKALGSKQRNPRDRPFVSTTQAQSRSAAKVEWSGEPSPPKSTLSSADTSFCGDAEAKGASNGNGNGGLFPPIKSTQSLASKGKAEWGETAMRKQAGSVVVTQAARELLAK